MNKVLFAVIYVVLMVPTYLWRLGGFNAMMKATDPNVMGKLAISVLVLMTINYILISLVTFFMVKSLNRPEIIIFPVVAWLFDVVIPIPMIPTILMIIALVCGLVMEKKSIKVD